MTKNELINRQFSLRCGAIYDIFAQICLHEFIKKCSEGKSSLAVLKTQLPEGEITLAQFFKKLDGMNNSAIVETKRNANRFLARNYFKELYRITESYCYSSNQEDVLKEQPWYQFARILVNCVSHSNLFEARRYKKELPVNYKGLSITEKNDGKQINVTLQFILELGEEILKFTKKKIK